MRRILHITNRFDQGGVDTLLLELLPLLGSKECLVDLLVLDKNHCSNKAELEQRGVKVIEGRYGNVYDPRNIGLIRRHARHYDIVHTHLFPTQLYAVLALWGVRRKPVLMTTEHCTTNNRRNYRWFRPIDRFMYRRYQRVVGVCGSATENLNRWACGAERLETIDNGIDLTRVERAEPYTKPDLGVGSDMRLVVMVARFFDQKDQQTAIRAMRYLPVDVCLALVGSGDTMEECRTLAHTLGVEDRVLFLGRRNDVPRIVAAADVCLLATHYEGMPISIIEYFCAGKPVVATDVDGVREMIDDPQMLAPHAADRALADRLEALLDDPRKMRQVGERNRSKSSHYDLSRMARQYRALYYLKSL